MLNNTLDGKQNFTIRVQYCAITHKWVASSEDLMGLGIVEQSLSVLHVELARQIPGLLAHFHDIEYSEETVSISLLIEKLPLITGEKDTETVHSMRDSWFADQSTTSLTREVGNEIARRMAECGIAVGGLAVRLNITEWKLWNLLGGRSNIPVRQLARVAAALNATVYIRVVSNEPRRGSESNIS